ncbi:Uncharacterised protein [Mycobacterium tuberculosis]|nr:Uncharacterised protein [Mycobacterium tuberculosis]COX36208.1 Uncharacterised protein [Mycobacterium tuberculosis]
MIRLNNGAIRSIAIVMSPAKGDPMLSLTYLPSASLPNAGVD